MSEFGKVLEDIIDYQQNVPRPVYLQRRHVQNGRLIEDRHAMLEFMPKGGVCAEVGVLLGEYTQDIFRKTQPRKLHLIDREPNFLELAKAALPQDQIADRVETHHGNSADIIAEFPDKYFDWIYIDADHTYEAVKIDLELARHKIKDGGLIVVDDYTMMDHLKMERYGVVAAVNRFCLKHDFEILYFAFQDQMFCNVALRKIQSKKERLISLLKRPFN